MKCPYRDFKECEIEKCPSCVYKEIKNKTIEGRKPNYMSIEAAIEKGCMWENVKTTYEFVSCKLIDNNVQPIPSKKTVNNITNKNVSIKRSIF